MANLNPAPTLYFIFYNLLYGLVFSFLVPLYCLRKEKATLASAGGQLIPKMAMGEQIPWHLLPLGILPLIMTTFLKSFYSEALCRAERQFGCVPAILISGAMFSLYHLGYPGFRTWRDLLLLFVVGIGFAAAYRISDNNLIVSFFVNLPNALVTYMLKYEQFPVMSVSFTIAAVITLVLIGLTFLLVSNRRSTEQ